MVNEASFGVIPLRKRGDEWNVLLIHQKNGDFWGFPKGHPNSGETAQESAARELKEETGLEIARWFPCEPFVETYSFHHSEKGLVQKSVTYYLAEVKGEAGVSDEIWGYKWLTLEEAAHFATYLGIQDICQKLEAVYKLQSDDLCD